MKALALALSLHMQRMQRMQRMLVRKLLTFSLNRLKMQIIVSSPIGHQFGCCSGLNRCLGGVGAWGSQGV